MKTLSLIVGIIIVAVVIIGGLMMYRSTQPDEAVLLDDSPLPESEGALDSQFIQQEPVGQPPAGDLPVSDSATEAESGVAADDSEVTISITDTGFVPASATVPVGGTVTFVNNGQGSHWPASDVHPTHEILPDFDSNRGLTTGERYSHTFTEAGTWDFHDHLRPNFTGTITVE